MTYVVRAAGDPSLLDLAMQREIAAIDPEQPIYDVRTMDDYLARTTSRRRFQTTVLGAFGAIAVLLAGTG